MPEIRSKSDKKPRRSATANKEGLRGHRPIHLLSPDRPVPGRLIKRHLLRQLTAIQINTAGLSGPYRSDAETMERVCGNHSAVREVRRLLRRSLLVPRKGRLWNLMLSASLTACDGDLHKAARLLGASVKQLRSSLPTQGEAKAP